MDAILFNVDKNDSQFIDSSGKNLYYFLLNSKVNLLIGENNSGKSRLIKSLLKKTKGKTLQSRFISNKNNNSNFKNSVIHYRDAFNLSNSLTRKTEEEKELDKKDVFEQLLYCLDKSMFSNLYLNRFNDSLRWLYSKDLSHDDYVVYIPILRGNENFHVYLGSIEDISNISMNLIQRDSLEKYIDKNKTVYQNKVASVYNINPDVIYTSETLYDNITDILLGSELEREEIHLFEKFISDNFFDGNVFSINPNRKAKCLKVKIGEQPEYSIHNIGDGIKQLINILYPVFMNRNKEKIFFIEEPEINLHPGLQRRLIEILASDELGNNKFIITTHSNHIMDCINYIDDIDIFKFKKVGNKFVIDQMNEDLLPVLNELGVNSTSVMLANCSIWVEGVSDRIYLRKYLDLYFKSKGLENVYKENIHYCFVEYGGSNLIHWDFDRYDSEISEGDIKVKALTNNAFLICDNDNSSKSNKYGKKSKKAETKEKLSEILGDKFYELPVREIENLIKLEVLENMLEKDNNIEHGKLQRKKYIDKQSSFYTQDKLSNPTMHIGSFIDDTYICGKKYKAYGTSKTIKDKAVFSRKICDCINEYDDLTEEAKDLVQKVANFIIISNA